MGNTNNQPHIGWNGAVAAPESSTQQHGDIVVEAISWPTRILMGAVIVVNLSLGIWLAQRSDFSQVQPQGAAPAAALDGLDDLVVETGRDTLSLQAAANAPEGP